MRKGDFFITYTGVQFWPLDPRIEDINIQDIAHALAHTCRWGGHSSVFYSVAQHSVVVSLNLSREDQLLGLMHDAAEAYIGDVKRPLKYSLPDLLDIEHVLWELIAKKFNCLIDIPKHIKTIDDRALLQERRDLIHPGSRKIEWGIDSLGLEPLPETIIPLAAEHAKEMFLHRFHQLHES